MSYRSKYTVQVYKMYIMLVWIRMYIYVIYSPAVPSSDVIVPVSCKNGNTVVPFTTLEKLVISGSPSLTV